MHTFTYTTRTNEGVQPQQHGMNVLAEKAPLVLYTTEHEGPPKLRPRPAVNQKAIILINPSSSPHTQ